MSYRNNFQGYFKYYIQMADKNMLVKQVFFLNWF